MQSASRHDPRPAASPPAGHSGLFHELFRKFSHRVSNAVGSGLSFFTALVVVVVWALTGPLFRFSDSWQLVINTGTTIVTFLMVFLIQNSQNRDALAIHLKLDELLRAVEGARTGLVSLQTLSDEELTTLQKEFEALHTKYGVEELVHPRHVATELAARRGRKR